MQWRDKDKPVLSLILQSIVAAGASANFFRHRLQFDEKMRQARRSWPAGDMPTLPLAC